jgi:ribosomal protein S27AE
MSPIHGGRFAPWWEHLTPPSPEITLARDLDAELQRAQQVYEDVAAEARAFRAEQQPCPICGRVVAEHTRRQLLRCAGSRPDLEIVR